MILNGKNGNIQFKPDEHDRHVGLSFLDICSPILKDFYHLWFKKCRGDLLPSKKSFLPEEMPQFLARLTLVECLDKENDFRYRIVGTGEVDDRGYNPTGKLVSECAYGDDWGDGAINNYSNARDLKNVIYDVYSFEGADGKTMTDECLFLPLSDDGISVNMIFVISKLTLARNNGK